MTDRTMGLSGMSMEGQGTAEVLVGGCVLYTYTQPFVYLLAMDPDYLYISPLAIISRLLNL